jgi:hypothetical protein
LWQGHALYEQLDDRRGVAEALVGLGQTAVVQGRCEDAQAVLEARAAGTNTWPRSRSTSSAMGCTCKAIRPWRGRGTNKP